MSSSKTNDSDTEAIDLAPVSEGIEQIVIFRLGEQRYALPIQVVQEIQQVVEFSQSETETATTVGIMNLRGAVIPVFYLRGLLGLPPNPYHVDTPMIICKAMAGLVSMIVDEVDDVVVVPEGALSPIPALHPLADVMLGVCRLGDELVVLLSVERLFSARVDGSSGSE